MSGFARSLAVVIGIDEYKNGIPILKTATNDAEAIAAIFRRFNYEVWLRRNDDATLEGLRELLAEIGREIQSCKKGATRLVFYFAGHGVALDSEVGPVGYLIPQDARRDAELTYLPMRELQVAFALLPCLHLLTILDCCFAGAFRWSNTRQLLLAPKLIHQERYRRFIQNRAWFALTSAAHNQLALDVLAGKAIGKRDLDQSHSPFAQALLEGLAGAADIYPPAVNGGAAGDGLITGTELYLHLLYSATAATQPQVQTPGLWPLDKENLGEFVFEIPGRKLNLPPAPQLVEATNPYRGLKPFEEKHADLFFGRERTTRKLHKRVLSHSLTIVVGSSGSGKSSLVKAGLIPRLRSSTKGRWRVLPAIRPGSDPLQALEALSEAEGVDANWSKTPDSLADFIDAVSRKSLSRRFLLFIDQLEELVTMTTNDDSTWFLQSLSRAIEMHPKRLRIILTVRSDFEPHFLKSILAEEWKADARFVLPSMTQDELREAITQPASVRVLFFNPQDLVDSLINEVIQMPGALALLSFTLSEMYFKYLKRGANDRTLVEADYKELGGVIGSLHHCANEEYDRLSAEEQATLRGVMLRMVTREGGEIARRRVSLSELDFPADEENRRVALVVQRMIESRLLVSGKDYEPYVEPAHDALVNGWDRLQGWIKQTEEKVYLQRRVAAAANDWSKSGRASGHLWDDNPRLSQLTEMLDTPKENWLNRLETQFVRKSRRRKKQKYALWTVLTAALMIGAVIAASVFYSQRNQARRQRNLSIAQALAAQSRLQEQGRLEERGALLARQAFIMNEGNGGTLWAVLDDSLRTVMSTPHFSNILLASQQHISAVAISKDCHWLAVGNDEGYVLFWDWSRPGEQPVTLPGQVGDSNREQSDNLPNTPLGRVGLGKSVNSLAFSPDGKKLVAANIDKTIRIWDLEKPDRSPLLLREHDDSVDTVAFSPDGNRMVTSSAHTLKIWDTSQLHSKPFTLPIKTGTLKSLAFSPDAKRLAMGIADLIPFLQIPGYSGSVLMWEFDAPHTPPVTLGPARSGVFALSFSVDGQTLYSADSDGGVRAWDIRRPGLGWREIGLLTDGSVSITNMAFNQDASLLAAGTLLGSVLIYDLHQPKVPATLLNGHRAEVTSLAFSPDGQYLFSGSEDTDNTVRAWSLRAPPGRPVGFNQLYRIISLRLGAYSEPLQVASSTDFKLWRLSASDTPTEATPRPVPLTFSTTMRAAAISPDGKLLAASNDFSMPNEFYTISVWDLTNPSAQPLVLGDHGNVVEALVISPDGDWLASGSADRTVKLWRLHQSAQQPIILNAHKRAVAALAFSADGKILVSGGFDRDICVWKMDNLERPEMTLKGAESAVFALAISPDGQWVAAGGEDRSIFIPPRCKERLYATEKSRTKELRFRRCSALGARQLLRAGQSIASEVYRYRKAISWLSRSFRTVLFPLFRHRWSPLGGARPSLNVEKGNLEALPLARDPGASSQHPRNGTSGVTPYNPVISSIITM